MDGLLLEEIKTEPPTNRQPHLPRSKLMRAQPRKQIWEPKKRDANKYFIKPNRLINQENRNSDESKVTLLKETRLLGRKLSLENVCLVFKYTKSGKETDCRVKSSCRLISVSVTSQTNGCESLQHLVYLGTPAILLLILLISPGLEPGTSWQTDTPSVQMGQNFAKTYALFVRIMCSKHQEIISMGRFITPYHYVLSIDLDCFSSLSH